MKKIDIERELSKFGWRFLRHGGNHDIWTNGEKNVAIPRHNEISKFTAKNIIKIAQQDSKENLC